MGRDEPILVPIGACQVAGFIWFWIALAPTVVCGRVLIDFCGGVLDILFGSDELVFGSDERDGVGLCDFFWGQGGIFFEGLDDFMVQCCLQDFEFWWPLG